MESPQLLESSNRVAVIDHHRRAASYIENAAFSFHEPYASSASELVTELLQYLVEPADLLREEAEATAEKLKECMVKLTAKAGNGGRLFGAVTTKEISDGLRQQFGIDIPKQKLVLDEPIKAFGSYQVKAKLGFEVNGTVYVSVFEEK